MGESFPSYQSLVVSSRFQLQQLVPFQVMPMAQLRNLTPSSQAMVDCSSGPLDSVKEEAIGGFWVCPLVIS